MINTKNLELKTLNTLKSVEVEPVMKVIPKATFRQIPVGCRQRFEFKESRFSVGSAIMAIRNLNAEYGRKEFVYATLDNQTAIMVYHVTPEIIDKAKLAYEDFMARKNAMYIQ